MRLIMRFKAPACDGSCPDGVLCPEHGDQVGDGGPQDIEDYPFTVESAYFTWSAGLK